MVLKLKDKIKKHKEGIEIQNNEKNASEYRSILNEFKFPSLGKLSQVTVVI